MTDESTDERRKAIKEALEKCSETVNRVMVSLLAVSLFCLLTTFGAADRSLVAPEATIKVPFADAPISFVGFLIVAPLLLVVLTIYLHVFYGYWRERDTGRRAQDLPETYPTLFSIDQWIARLLTAFSFYWLAPLVLATITWKAAARLEWGLPIAVVTGCMIAGLVFLIVRRGSRRWHKVHAASLCLAGLLAVIAPVPIDIIVHHRDLGKMESWERPLNLFRADLKGAWLVSVRLNDANLWSADLSGATLTGANLSGTNLFGADLTLANLSLANLTGATLTDANLSGAKLTGATLTDANLSGANLRDVKELTCDQVRAAKTDETTKLPISLVCTKTWPTDKMP
jgi:hypothetical protein